MIWTLIPWGAVLRGLAVAALIATPYLYGHLQGEATVQARWDAEKLAQQQAANKERERIAQEQHDALDEAQRLANRSRAAAGAAHDADVRLWQRLAAGAASRTDPTPGSAGPPADTPALVPADVLRRIDEAAGQFAEYADRARDAGATCERSYDALTAH